MSGEADDLLKKLELHRSLKDASPGFHIGDSDIDVIIEALKRRGVEMKRADDNGETCRQMFRRMEAIRDAASAALRMEWLLTGNEPEHSTKVGEVIEGVNDERHRRR